MKHIFFLLLISTTLSAQNYPDIHPIQKLTWKEKLTNSLDFSEMKFHWTDGLHFLGTTLVAIGHGWREVSIAYQKDLDRGLGISETSYFGSQAWKSRYGKFENGMYQNKKPEMWNWTTSGKHGVRTFGTGIMLTSVFCIGMEKRNNTRCKIFKATCEGVYLWGGAGIAYTYFAEKAGH